MKVQGNSARGVLGTQQVLSKCTFFIMTIFMKPKVSAEFTSLCDPGQVLNHSGPQFPHLKSQGVGPNDLLKLLLLHHFYHKFCP